MMTSNSPFISLSHDAQKAIWRILGAGESLSLQPKKPSSYDLIKPVLEKHARSENLNSDIQEVRSWFDTDQNNYWLKHEWHEPVANLIIPEIKSKINSEQKETAVWAAGAICAESSLPIIRSNWSSTEVNSFIEVAISVLEEACYKDLVINADKLYFFGNHESGVFRIPKSAIVWEGEGILRTFIRLERNEFELVHHGMYPVVLNLIHLIIHLRPDYFQKVIKKLDHLVVQIHVAYHKIAVEKEISYCLSLEPMKALEWITQESCDSVIALAIVNILNAANSLGDTDSNILLQKLVSRLSDHLSPSLCTRWIGELLSGAPYILDSSYDNVPPRIEQLEESCTKLLVRLINQIEWKDFFQKLCAGLRLTPRSTWTRHLAALAWEIRAEDPAKARIVAQATIDEYEQQIKEKLQKGEMYISWESYHDYEWTRGIGICLVLAQPRPDPFAWIVEHCRQSPLSVWDVEENYKAFLTANRAVEHWFLVGFDSVKILNVLDQPCDHQTVRKILELFWSHCHFVKKHCLGNPENSAASQIATGLAVDTAPDDNWLLDIARHSGAGPLVLWAMLHERRRIANRAETCTHAGNHFEKQVKIIAQQKFHDDDLLDFHSLQYWAKLWLLLEAADEAERTAIAFTTLSTRQTDRSTNVLILKLLALASTGKQLPELVIKSFQNLYRKTWQHSTLNEEQADREMVDRCLRQASIRIP